MWIQSRLCPKVYRSFSDLGCGEVSRGDDSLVVMFPQLAFIIIPPRSELGARSRLALSLPERQYQSFEENPANATHLECGPTALLW